MADLLITNVDIVDPVDGVRRGDIVVDGGRIVEIALANSGISAAETIDGTGLHAFPGVIDPHTHIGFAGNFVGDLQSETRSAAKGGVTTLLSFHRHYASADPEPYDVDELATYIEDNAAIDVGLHFGMLTREQVRHLPDYIDAGVSSFKFYLAYRGADAKTVGMVNEIDDGAIYEAFQHIGRRPHAVAGIHAENTDIVADYMAKVRPEGDDLAAWSAARPVISEMEGVSRMAFFARLTGAALYIVHIGSPEVIDFAAEQRAHVKISLETCPHYLTHTTETEVGNLAKINPPIRDLAAQNGVWKRLFDGVIDTIGTDHCAVHSSTKSGSMWDASAGFSGMATLLPVLISEGHHRRGLSLEAIARLTSTNSARLFNMPTKGRLTAGSDADIALVNLEEEWVVDPAQLDSASDFSIYQGQTLTGRPVVTVARGDVVMVDGEVTATAGRGHFLRR